MALDTASTDQVGARDAAPLSALTVKIPVHLVSPNSQMHEHWRSRHHRRQRERDATAKALEGRTPPPGPWQVTITRVATRRTDTDNLAYSAKTVRDECSAWLGVDDGDETMVTWAYSQRVARVPTPAGPHGARDPKKPAFQIWAEVTIASRP